MRLLGNRLIFLVMRHARFASLARSLEDFVASRAPPQRSERSEGAQHLMWMLEKEGE